MTNERHDIIVSLCAFCYNKSVLFPYHKAISQPKPELLAAKKKDALNIPQDLEELKKGISPEETPQKVLTDPADNVLTLIDALGSKEPGKKAERKEAVLTAVAGLMLHYLKPEVKKKKEEEKPKKETKEEVSVAPARQEGVVQLASVKPNATPAQIEKAVKTNFKNLAELYENYRKTKDPTELRYFLKKAITEKESGVNTNPKLRLRLVNQAAIGERKRRYMLDNMGITVPPLPGSSSKLVTEECLKDFNSFKERVCSQLQPDVSDPVKRVNNTAEILARCAIGKYQILPIYHIPGMQKQGSGEEKLLKIYQFITSEETQSKGADSIIENLGARYDWNPQSMMVAYYAGVRWGDKLKTDPNNPAFTKDQYGGHGSMLAYIENTTKLADRIIRQSKNS